MLDSLNTEAGNAERASERLQKTVKDLQQLLSPGNLTVYNFKKPARLANNVTRSGASKPNGTPAHPTQQPQLTSFANMVYNSTRVDYRYPTPESPSVKQRGTASSAAGSKPAIPHTRPAVANGRPAATAPAPNSARATPTSSTTLQSLQPASDPRPSLQKRPSSTSQYSQVEVLIETPSRASQAPRPPVNARHNPQTTGYHHGDATHHHTQQQMRPSQSNVAVVIPSRLGDNVGHAVKSSVHTERSTQQKPLPTNHYHAHDERPASQTAFRSSQTDLAVVVPAVLSQAERAAYISIPDTESAVVIDNNSLSRPKALAEDIPEHQLTSATLDQREKANGAASRLQGLMSDIFEAEDQLQPDTSGVQSTNAAHYFQVEDGADIERPVLQPKYQGQLDLFLQKVINSNRFASIDVEQLGRVMKLCENAISAGSGTSFRIDEDSLRDGDDWARRMTAGEQGLYASRSLLRIMTAGREEKQLYSEDTLRNLLDFLSHVVDTCIIPTVEMRHDIGEAFKFASHQQKSLLPVLSQCSRVMKLLGDLLLKTDVDESAINTVESICKTLVFVENASSEKDSALGVQKFESVRLAAMDVLSKLFARYTEQRQFVFDEILTSLEKLPVSRQSARQFKMVDAKPIQLVSALLMRLIQTSATKPPRDQRPIGKELDSKGAPDQSDTDMEDQSEYDSDSSTIKVTNKKRKKSSKKSFGAEGDLQSLVNPLYEAALKDTYYVINYLLQRAMTSTKTGDTPYRNLLDIFTEDFLSVLGNTDWPAAELLLRALLSRLLEISDSKTSSAPSKSMALELMGSMATRITAVRLQAQQVARHNHSEESEIRPGLLELHEGLLSDDLTEADLLAFDGPYRVVLEYLQARHVNDTQLLSARGYHTMQWSKLLLSLQNPSASTREVEKRLAHMIWDAQWLENEYEFTQVSTEDGRFASLLSTLHLPFCRAFNRIFTKLLNSMAGDQASLRSKSLKSIEQLIEMDPSMLDRGNFVMHNITKCLMDTSTQVRDSALGLISKCLSLRPRLDTELCDRIIQRSHDANVHVRKRAMKMLKDIYLRHDTFSLKARIADALVLRIVDVDESVVDLARHTFEDIWMSPFYAASGSSGANVDATIRLHEQAALIVNIVNKKSDSSENVLAELVQGVLSPEKSKNAKDNFSVCRQMVKTMFEAIIDSAELPGNLSQNSVLQTLTVFSSADAKLFMPDQLQTLVPYVKNLTTDDNLLTYRSAIVILRHTLPHMRNLNKDFLAEVQISLIQNFQKLPKAELSEVAACLWMLDGGLKNTQKLARITGSVLAQVKKFQSAAINDATATKVKRLTTIAGAFVKAFNLDTDLQAPDGQLKKIFPEYKGNSVASLAVDIICPLTSPKQTSQLREAALESVSMICQTWPNQLMRADVCNAFELVFASDDRQLDFILVSGLKEFFSSGDKPGGDGAAVIELGGGVATGEERLGNTYVATDRDGAATSIAQRFLHSILRVSISSADELALIAAQVVASINRQGLVHPKESGPYFVALETCPDNKIANVAFQEHRALYSKHETMFEKENIRSIQQAFEYQRDIIHDALGYVGSPPAAKLNMFWEVLKTGTAKPRKKFLTTICTKMNFVPAKLDVSGDIPTHVSLVRFCVENLAFFDYSKMDELQHLAATLERVVSDTGTGISHAIEVELLKLRIENVPMLDVQAIIGDGAAVKPEPLQQADDGPDQKTTIDPLRLRQLTVYSQILLLLWGLRTYLRRLWNLAKATTTSRGRPPAAGKDAPAVVRAAQRIPNSANLTERFLARTSEIVSALQQGQDKQRALCASFAELMAVDNELKVAADGADDDFEDTSLQDTSMTAPGAANNNGDINGGYETPSEGSVRSASAAPSVPGSAHKRGKKRKSVGDSRSASNTPRKKGKGAFHSQQQAGVNQRRTSRDGDDEDDFVKWE
ncbi:hypothetical protein AAFC00_001869 [Neodothiora populina]|uniref:Sister chromatid cohesion protein n=1 Tax=Neodothiora populina TaxID=2781224 RepID=A0ABR3PQK9_9PEZI